MKGLKMSTELIPKIAQAKQTIEDAGNTVEVIENTNEWVKITALRFRSIEQHPLLRTQGQVLFATTWRHGHTRFLGGELYSFSSGATKIRTYRDLEIVTDVYTSTSLLDQAETEA